ncbi:uncharacterized protein LOC135359584 isoform X2 [Latimeria chalumnae]|uniref:uncharacterized protein LOC135359584 isoform X2 n=1 Tax=Latimeria chalumnae TaxID=7897 RepID=UPI00313AD729
MGKVSSKRPTQAKTQTGNKQTAESSSEEDQIDIVHLVIISSSQCQKLLTLQETDVGLDLTAQDLQEGNITAAQAKIEYKTTRGSGINEIWLSFYFNKEYYYLSYDEGNRNSDPEVKPIKSSANKMLFKQLSSGGGFVFQLANEKRYLALKGNSVVLQETKYEFEVQESTPPTD